MANKTEFRDDAVETQDSIGLRVNVWKAGQQIVGLASRNPEGRSVVAAVDFKEVPLPQDSTPLPFVLSKALEAGFEVEAITSDGARVLIRGIPTSGGPSTKDSDGGDPSGDREPRNPVQPTLSSNAELELIS